MKELPLITRIHGVRVFHNRDGSTPATYLKVQTGTPTGQLDLSISIAAAKQLAEDIQKALQGQRFR